jgi:hypothetical protein
VELKAIKALEDAHFATVRSYLSATGLRVGLLVNFNASTLVVKRIMVDRTLITAFWDCAHATSGTDASRPTTSGTHACNESMHCNSAPRFVASVAQTPAGNRTNRSIEENISGN